MSVQGMSVRAAACGVLICTFSATAQNRRVAEVLEHASRSLSEPAVRQAAVDEIERGERARRDAAVTRAKRLGLPLRGTRPDGGAFELADFDGDTPLYLTTLNLNAGISTGSNLLRASPYFTTGVGGTVGVWDASSARMSHVEFGGRVTAADGVAATVDHSTHVVGTICASGVDPLSIGMATAVRVDSYDWNNDSSEMTARGATYPGEAGKINISNHSYGYNTGWVYMFNNLAQANMWTWYGSGTTAAGVEDSFGQYNTISRDIDSLAYGMPYFLMFWAAGNDRNNNPTVGVSVALVSNGTPVTYDPALHPPGDGVYKSGYDTVGYTALAKNVLTIGAVTDAVSGGLRSVGAATVNSFSSWGPADDGRIKPDVVANGYSLKSTSYSGDSAYSTMSGTSMASPNAAGTAQQLVHYLGRLFTNHVLRASTLKALLIHTADDKGNAGPDYVYGWGLVNGLAAADLLAAYRTNAGTQRVIENLVATNRTSVSFSFAWDGANPIRATLCWSDPAGTAIDTHDARSPNLVNNLDLRVTGPSGTVYQPWVMPFVGDWSAASCSSPATTGSNATDNVEQVLIAAPTQAGVYTARVSYGGALTNGRQPFSLLLSGVAPAQKAPAPTLTASAPLYGAGELVLTHQGDCLMTGAAVRLKRAGQPDAPGAGVEVSGDSLKARYDASGMAPGWWHLLVTNPDGQRAVLYNAFAAGTWPLWREDFEVGDPLARGWSTLSEVGTGQWAPSSVKSVSPARSMFCSGAASRSDTSLVSPPLAVPASGLDFQLSFWHDFDFEFSLDGGVLEFSLDGGAWFDVTEAGSGAAFAAEGYTATISGTGSPSSRNPLTGRSAWSGSSGGFRQVIVSVTDMSRYAGRSLRVRWRLGTNNSTASVGWYVDDVVLSGVGAPPDMTRPTVLLVR